MVVYTRWLWALLLPAILGCAGRQAEPPDRTELLLFCGAGIRPPVEEIAALFEREHGVRVECDFAGSEVLLGRIQLTGRGDLYMPGDIHYIRQADERGLIASQHEACYFVPVILVAKDNPLNIATLDDLVRPGVKLGLGDPAACAIGRKSAKIFADNGIAADAVERNVAFRSATVHELGNHLKLGTLDAVIVWDAVAAYFVDVAEVVRIPEDQNVISTVAVGVLKDSPQPDAARRFAEFVASTKGRAVFKRHHYTVSLDAADIDK